VIRPAEAADLPGVERLLAGAALPTDGLADQFPAAYVVATSPDGPIAAAGVEVHDTCGLLRSVVVAPSARGTGLGKALVADRLAWARAAGLREVYLLTTTAPDFFAALGFARLERAAAPPPIRSSREFASLCPGTSVLMRLVL
jgi:amino-acid N-acetyltransferase